jgi:hypothetical protein
MGSSFGPDVHPLTSTGRRVRVLAALFLVVAVTVGTFWGQDDHFPVGPFRMYSVANKTNGAIRVPALEATTASGTDLELNFEDTGLRRAEVEGQMDRFLADPSLLRHLATGYERLHDSEELVEIRLVEDINYLRDGKTYRTERRPLVSWTDS